MRAIVASGELVAALRAERCAGASIGLVPTMGALHAGHTALVEAARQRHDLVVVSIFVNPLQFDRADDLERYPRDLGRDLDAAAGAGVDVCFAPSAGEMYPFGEPVVRVCTGALGAVLEGASRPGHFDGVATVVSKLLALVSPDAAYFGEKDYQQLVVVRRMVSDLSVPVEVVGCPTVREQDGLAMSSRNSRLAPQERRAATVVHRALQAGRDAVIAGSSLDEVTSTMAHTVEAEPRASLDYARVVTPQLEVPQEPLSRPLRLLVAAWVGQVRLIDNLEVAA